MSGRKMIPPHPRKQPPPEFAVQQMAIDHELEEIASLQVRTILDGVILEFSQTTEFVLMRPQAARKLAAKLIACADELETEVTG